MTEFIDFFVDYFLDIRKMAATLTLLLASGLAAVWISMEFTNLIATSERVMIGSIIASLMIVSTSLLFARPRNDRNWRADL